MKYLEKMSFFKSFFLIQRESPALSPENQGINNQQGIFRTVELNSFMKDGGKPRSKNTLDIKDF